MVVNRWLAGVVWLVGGPDRIRAAVEARLAQVMAEPMTADESLHDQIQARVQRLRQKVDQAPKRILEEDDDELRADLRIALRELKTELADAEKTLAEVGSRVPDRARGTDLETEVRNALAIMDRIEAICSDPTARAELPGLFKDLGIRIGLNFREGRRNSRAVRPVTGGIMAFGNRPLPCTLRNTNGRPLAEGLPLAADNQAHHSNCCNGHREKRPGEAETAEAVRSIGASCPAGLPTPEAIPTPPRFFLCFVPTTMPAFPAWILLVFRTTRMAVTRSAEGLGATILACPIVSRWLIWRRPILITRPSFGRNW